MKLATQKQAPHSIQPQRWLKKRRRLSLAFIYSILCVVLLITVVLAVSFGSVSIPFTTIVRILLNGSGLFHFARQWDATIEIIVWQVRMPVVIGAALVGAALAVSGALFQGMLRNPLADPFLIGTSSGAALGATIAFVLPFATFYGTYFPLTMILAFLGALATVFFVYGIARSGGRTPVVTLLLAGVVVNAVLVALQTLILALFPREQFQLQALFNWLSGGIQVTNWLPLVSVTIVVVLGMALALSFARVLDSLALGEESASHLGLHVELYKFLIVVTASCLTAAAVSISGLVGFVGLVTPHVMRLLLGPNHRTLLPASALGGAIFLTLADLLARVVVAPTVLPVGVFTALVGAPFFLLLLRRSRRDYRW
ncbi:corrinoid ABC transporter permease [Reticulibacter mediterranei]|uniref:Corrinoid ABC transporter permease n=1 Tax=Reticulibacter mediterranei TaxID=2778369 RepID=A0A8J3IK66_9CHLR|nr:iron ABC transporter permease [Reticulibacter mediterranei]GHO95996.1 corrinoid ABC transporter permease [Reticulibacter mediterranei]